MEEIGGGQAQFVCKMRTAMAEEQPPPQNSRSTERGSMGSNRRKGERRRSPTDGASARGGKRTKKIQNRSPSDTVTQEVLVSRQLGFVVVELSCCNVWAPGQWTGSPFSSITPVVVATRPPPQLSYWRGFFPTRSFLTSALIALHAAPITYQKKRDKRNFMSGPA